MQVYGIEHIDLSVSDLGRSRAFYELLLLELGFRPIDHPSYVAWSNGHLGIGLRESNAASPAAPVDRYEPGLHHLALRAGSRSDVDELAAFMSSNEMRVLDPPAEYPEYGPDYYAVFFADPDGIKLEYAHFPWGYWKRVQTQGHDERPRQARSSPPDAVVGDD